MADGHPHPLLFWSPPLFFRVLCCPAEAEALRTKHRDAESEMREAERTMKELEGKIGSDYGPDGRFHYLAATCVEFKPGGEFSYELCPFKNAQQKDSRGSGTSVGNWHGFGKEEEDANSPSRYETMRFTGGQHCWNAGARTLTVALTCGAENKILGVEEPEVCKYAMRFETPAACTEAHKAAAQADLDLLSAERKDEL